jgi:hypothetical protein
VVDELKEGSTITLVVGEKIIPYLDSLTFDLLIALKPIVTMSKSKVKVQE